MKHNISDEKAKGRIMKPRQRDESAPKQPYMNAYKRAQQTYERLERERRERAEQARRDKVQRAEALGEYTSLKQKMNRALMKRNKKGQPKLDAQVAVLYEKIQRRATKKK